MFLQPMQREANISIGADLTDEDFIEAARSLLSHNDVKLVPNMLVMAERHPAVWETEAGQALLIGMVEHLMDAFEFNDVGDAMAAIKIMTVCPQHLAVKAYELMFMAFYPDGEMGDPVDLADSVALTFALLIGAAGEADAVAPFLDRAQVARICPYFRRAADALREQFAPPAPEQEHFKAKLVIWDLDDTLWQGTLADGDEPVLFDHRAEFVRAFNRHGIVSAVCSKNDFATAREKLEAFGLWDEFVFPRIAFVPKGAVIRQMIADMRLRPANVLFIDDNAHNLHEVADAVPGIHVMDATSAECDVLLQKILHDNAHVDKSRVADYRLIETRVAEREDNALSDEAFLMQSGIHATVVHRMDNLEFAGRMEELINRSNQLNYTASRIAPGVLEARILSLDYIVMSVFVWDKYGYYGLVGVAVLNWQTRQLEHLAFSCRIMHMGIEDAMIRKLTERFQIVSATSDFIDAAQLRKPLPAQSSQAVTVVGYEDPDVRLRILKEEVARDPSDIALRIMADCQSGAFHHYSRFRDIAEHDNHPRLFSLPMMMTGRHKDQLFPRYLVFTVATDYSTWRWGPTATTVDVDLYRECARRFTQMVCEGDHKCLLLLPPENLRIEKYLLYQTCDKEAVKARHAVLNAVWRDIAACHPDAFTVIELGEALSEGDVFNSQHYAPSALRHIAGLIDGWYEGQTSEAGRAAA